MARLFPGGVATDRIVTDTGIQGSTLFSLSCWLKPTAYDASGRRLWDWRDSVTDANFNNRLSLVNPGGGSVLEFLSSWTAAGVWTVVAPSAGSWHHLGITYDAGSTSNVPVIYLDGSPVTVTTLSVPTGTFDGMFNAHLCLGCRNISFSSELDAALAEFALWNRILTAREMAGLAKGFAPGLLPRGQIFYDDLIGRRSPELWRATGTGGTATVTGTTPVDHPRTLYPIGLSLPAHDSTPAPTGSPFTLRQSTVRGGDVLRGVAAGGGITEATGSASGAASGSGVGAAIDTSDGAATGPGAASGAGGAIAQTDGVSAGAGAASSAAATVLPGAASADGVGVVAGIGAAIDGGEGSAAGTGTASGVAAAIDMGVGSADGIGAASGVGAAIDGAVGSAAGVGAADAVGEDAAGNGSTGSASGSGAASGVGSAVAIGAGHSAGTGAVDGPAAVIAAGVGASEADAAVSGHSGAIIAAAGEASGAGEVQGESPSTIVIKPLIIVMAEARAYRLPARARTFSIDGTPRHYAVRAVGRSYVVNAMPRTYLVRSTQN